MRALRILLILLVVVGGIFVVADRFAVNYAEGEVAAKVRSSQGLSAEPQIDIKGFPFLTQVLGKKLDQVDVTMDGVETSAQGRSLKVGRMTAELHDVTLSSNFSSATAARATGTAVISYDDLTRAAGDKDVKLAFGGNGKVKVTGTVSVLGREIQRSVLSSVSLKNSGKSVAVRADEVPGQGIPGLEGMIRKKIDFERPIGGLPNGLVLDKITPVETGMEIGVTGTDVHLAG
ncbi:LmeA family phospholipid-binding protein [Streptomyces sp. NPDC054863]